MIPEIGPDCDLCTPEIHFWLTCPACARQWDEPPYAGAFTCRGCGQQVEVTPAELDAWLRDVVGIAE